MNSLSDRIAIEQCRNGDIGGLELLAQRYQVSSLRLAFLLTGDRDAAQDIVQESFIRAYQRIHQFHVGQPFGPWFHRIVINMAHQYRRSALHQQTQDWNEDDDGRLASDSLTLPEVAVLQEEIQQEMESALKSLPEKQRTVIVLRYYLNYTDQEIAAIVGCSHAAARQRLHAGRHTLRAIIRQDYPWLIQEEPSLPENSTSFAKEA